MTGRPAMRAAACCLLMSALGLGGCLTVRYNRERVNRPPSAATEVWLDALEPGSSPLSDLLSRLGAPEIVWAAEGDGDVVLAWAWQDADNLGARVSYSFQRFAGASFDADSAKAERQAIVCVLTPELRLRAVRRGVLRDLVPRSALQNPAR